MKQSELTEMIKNELSTLVGTTNDKRFEKMFPYIVEKAEGDPYLYFKFMDGKNQIASSCENIINSTYGFNIVRKYDNNDRYSTELAIQNDIDEIIDLFIMREEVFPEVLNIELEDFYIDDQSTDNGNSKVAVVFLKFSYMKIVE